MFTNAASVAVRYVTTVPITVERPEQAAAVLDARLHQLALEGAGGVAF